MRLHGSGVSTVIVPSANSTNAPRYSRTSTSGAHILDIRHVMQHADTLREKEAAMSLRAGVFRPETATCPTSRRPR